ncbi:hypothetical protein TRICI_003726 [Trichomonascus ciferrii]|uniref:Secreted protein n=1 Tax=Trichomonascus ciferrii TaxID=44093 RepID=A0A642V2D2_9ASCO|nr:hypothetical protein TRICI_003726 [Trichomonascus ciferrii]
MMTRVELIILMLYNVLMGSGINRARLPPENISPQWLLLFPEKEAKSTSSASQKSLGYPWPDPRGMFSGGVPPENIAP